jgi:hypothetical protein
MRRSIIRHLLILVTLSSIGFIVAPSANGGPLEPPQGFKRYLAGVKQGDVDAILSGFTQDPVVVDVGRRIEGRKAIRQWLKDEVLGLRYEVLSTSPAKDKNRVLVKITLRSGGSFKAHYDLTVDKDGLISHADLKYAD